MVTALSFSQDSPEEMKSNADKLFDNEQYVEATSLYLRVLSLEPRNSDLNFKYGACLLYNSNQKKDALKYLNYSVTDEQIDPRAFYFRGRAMHLDYQFEEARKQYEIYQSKIGGKYDDRYDVDRNIDMCRNGKKLLTTFTDIIVAEKQEIAEARFFDIYSDSRTIGGDILVSAQFQSKLDKKMGHTPVVHFPPNAKAIYYSSYGDNLSTGKDIYISRRLPNGKWGEAQLLPGDVNTNEDEDYPYMHPSENFLYFSSKGHNSMGGYDVFMSRKNHETGSFKTPENVDFAISSPDDDLFYVVDSLFQNAYFASARQSQDGKLHVYRVKVARVPIQEIIVMGEYVSEVDPGKNNMSVTLLTHSNGNDLGLLKSNKKGKYSYVFPQGGKYDYIVTIDGSDTEYKFTVELPFLDEFRPLKQKILHTKNEEGQEIIKIINLFDETVEGAEAMIAQVIRKKAELNVNVDNFDLEQIEAEKHKEEILAGLGYKGMSMPEVVHQLEILKMNVSENDIVADRIDANLGEEILIKSERIIELNNIEKELTKKAEETDDPALKYKLLKEARQKQIEKDHLIGQVKDLKTLSGVIENELSGDSGVSGEKIGEIEKEFNELVDAGDDEGALMVLVKNKDVLNEAKEISPKGILDEYVDESVRLRNDIKELKETLDEYKNNKTQVEAQIRTLNLKKGTAKKKELEKIESEIASKEVELGLIDDGIKSTERQIQTKEKQLNSTEDQMASFQNAMATEEVSKVDPVIVEETEVEIAKITESEPTDFEAEIAQLEEEHPELNGGTSVVSQVPEIKNANDQAEEQINNDPSLSEIEKTYRLIDNNGETAEAIKTRVEEIDSELESGSNPTLEKEKEELMELEAELERETEALTVKAEELKAGTPDVAVSPEDVIKEIAPDYENEIAAIEANSGLSPREKLDATINTQRRLEGKVNAELEAVQKQLEENPSDEEAKGRKEVLEGILDKIGNDIAETQAEIEALPVEVASTGPTKEEVIGEVSPTHSVRVKEIEEDPNKTLLEKEEALKVEEEKLLEEIADEKKGLEKTVKKNPDDEEAAKRLEVINELEAETQESIDERNKEIEKLKETESPIASISEVKDEVIEDIDPKYVSTKEEIENSDDSPFGKKLRVASVEAGLLEALYKEKEDLDKTISKNPDDEEAKARLEIVDQMIAEQESIIDEIKAEGVEGMTTEDKEAIISAVDPTYIDEIKTLTDPEEIVSRENELQEKLEEEIKSIEKQLKRGYSVSVDLELAATRKLLDESNKREEVAKSGGAIVDVNPDPQRKEEFVEEIRGSLLEGNPEVLTSEFTTKEDLENQVEVLTAYEEAIDTRIEEVKGEIESNPTKELEEELGWLEEEKDEVIKKRKRAMVSIGELETNVIASTPNSSQSDPELQTLEQEENAIKTRLEEDMTSGERKKLNKELEEVEQRKAERNNEIVEEEIVKDKDEGTVLIEKVEEIAESNPENPVADKVKAHYEKEDVEIDELVEKAKDGDSEAERNYLLGEAKKKRDDLNKGVQEVIAEQETKAIEEEHGISLSSPEDLQKKKRRFTIGIGELTTAIAEVEEEIKTAKRKEIPALEEKRDGLIAEKELLESRLEEVDNQIQENEKEEVVISDAAMKQPLTFNEERKIAGSEEYEEYQGLAVEALKVENEIRSLEGELEKERAAIQRMIVEGADGGSIDDKAAKIKELESDIERLGVDLTQKKYIAEQALPENQEEAMKMQNLVARGVKPVKTAVIATALFQLPSAGLAINTESESPNNGSVEIPVGVESPSGLVYRVQVGAFAKPIASTVFREFNPVSGEKIEGTNITRYMAGFFNNSDDVVKARGDIRGLGYSDAFVVAYCDGDRITFGEARRLEAQGKCVPKGNNEIMMEVAVKTAEKLGIPVSNEVQEVPELTYNQAPGAAEAEPIENMKGLFFTVQVGVFNRPVAEKDLHYMPDIVTIRLPNGLIRYSSGRFDSVDDALPRLKYARESGVGGAFVTAYYNGERISIGNARRLLLENGKSILQSEMEKEIPVQEVITPADVVRMDSVRNDVTEIVAPMELWEHRVQIVTKKTFDVFPRDVLNRYNAEGSFYYDVKDKKVKSVIYKNADYLPRIWNFRDDIDTVYLPVGQLADTKTEIVGVVFSDSIIPGDFMDWMLRCNYRREIFKTYKGTEVRIFGVDEDDLDIMLEKIELFGVKPEVILETEEELELEENK